MRAIAVLLAGGALAVLAYRTQVDALSPRDRALATVAIGLAFVVAGVAAWVRRRVNRLGPLMIAAGLALLARQLRYSHDPVIFTTFFALGDVCFALMGHAVFAYPFGRLRGRAERAIVVAGYTVMLVFPVAVMLVYGRADPLFQYTPHDNVPRESVINITSSPHTVELLQKAQIVAFYGVLASLFILVIGRNLLVASPRMRRVLLPTIVGGVALALRALFESIYTFSDRLFAYNVLFWWQIGAGVLLPLALAIGLLRARLARAAVGDLLLALERTPTSDLCAALARTLDDPTLELALWLPRRRRFVDAAGRDVVPPEGDPRRGVTRIEHDGEPVAALIHDRSLLEEPELVQAAAAAARMALENARLQAELRAQLQLVEDSRSRIAQAADDERRRIERDLHDGAQQELLAIALDLRRLGRAADPTLERALAPSVDALASAVQNLRELARGVHPTILAEGGLASALDSLAASWPLPLTVDATPERFPQEVEATAYFLIRDALANVLKHAGATAVCVRARRDDGTLVVEVQDDGVGGAGLPRSLSDRVEAAGGRLHIESPPGRGTLVIGEIPCAS